MANQAPVVQPGSQFDIPGVPNATQWYDQYEDTQDLALTPGNTQKSVLNIQDMRRTDVVFDWEYVWSFANVVTFDVTDVNRSAYFPYNIFGPVKMLIQNQYSCIDVENGIDWYIFNLVRPYRKTAADRLTNNYANTAGSPVGTPNDGFLYAGDPQANLVAPAQFGSAAIAANTTDNVNIVLDLPAGVWFDEYYALDVSGNFLAATADTFVSPQYMAGTQRLIRPSIKTNPLIAVGSGSDESPYNEAAAGTSTVASTGSLNIRRHGVYGNNVTASLPAPQPWQYQWLTQRFAIAGVSRQIIQIPDDAGQVLFLYLRLWDPAANGGLGAPIQTSALTKVSLLYGSGLTRFEGTPLEFQALWIAKHGVLLPPGVIGYDCGLDELGTFSNKRALNTLNTAGIEWSLEFAAPTSNQAYAVLGTESLVYVV